MSRERVIEGIGTDIIETRRIQDAIERHGNRFLDRILTEGEQTYCQRYNDPHPHYAGRFAAKEAIVKALGTGFHEQIAWTEIEVINDTQGKPEVHLSSRLRKHFPKAHIFVSISHCIDYATATAILVG